MANFAVALCILFVVSGAQGNNEDDLINYMSDLIGIHTYRALLLEISFSESLKNTENNLELFKVTKSYEISEASESIHGKLQEISDGSSIAKSCVDAAIPNIDYAIYILGLWASEACSNVPKTDLQTKGGEILASIKNFQTSLENLTKSVQHCVAKSESAGSCLRDVASLAANTVSNDWIKILEVTAPIEKIPNTNDEWATYCGYDVAQKTFVSEIGTQLASVQECVNSGNSAE